MSEKRSVMLGGTFNPPHNGHVAVINNLLNQLDIDRVIAVPAH
ncbi:MAG: adenylyltransferase/cytidyltransferase family protein, partial [Spirochaetia bacterium]|nr:adenylyltransferase/cytidyltransferase family protein [Spirochaetia bacterium]